MTGHKPNAGAAFELLAVFLLTSIHRPIYGLLSTFCQGTGWTGVQMLSGRLS
jgi:hypothetical protein